MLKKSLETYGDRNHLMNTKRRTNRETHEDSTVSVLQIFSGPSFHSCSCGRKIDRIKSGRDSFDWQSIVKGMITVPVDDMPKMRIRLPIAA